MAMTKDIRERLSEIKRSAANDLTAVQTKIEQLSAELTDLQTRIQEWQKQEAGLQKYIDWLETQTKAVR